MARPGCCQTPAPLYNDIQPLCHTSPVPSNCLSRPQRHWPATLTNNILARAHLTPCWTAGLLLHGDKIISRKGAMKPCRARAHPSPRLKSPGRGKRGCEGPGAAVEGTVEGTVSACFGRSPKPQSEQRCRLYPTRSRPTINRHLNPVCPRPSPYLRRPRLILNHHQLHLCRCTA